MKLTPSELTEIRDVARRVRDGKLSSVQTEHAAITKNGDVNVKLTIGIADLREIIDAWLPPWLALKDFKIAEGLVTLETKLVDESGPAVAR